jgi:two-component system, response regulator YesN
MKFLIVDDNEQFRVYVREMLLKPGDECRELDDGMCVNTVYGEFKPDWVLLDIRMKKMNGLEAGERLKKEFPSARFVMVSNYDDQRFCQKAKSLGAEAFVAKENLCELYDVIHAHAQPMKL